MKITKDFKNIKTIGILGLAYKEDTNSTKNSPSISFIKKISINSKFKINVYDPRIKKLLKHRDVNFYKKIEDLMKNCDVLVIATPWNIFKEINLNKFSNIKAIIDPYNIINFPKNRNKNSKYISMGN